MKRLILLIVTLAAAATRLFAAHLCPSTGRVVDEQGKAVEYATVVLLKGTEQVAGMATDAEGRFALKAAPGEYTLLIQYLGFDPVKKPVRVEQENHLGDFVMRTSATGIESVEVKARLVRREAARFVVDVANAPAAIGKDGIELLERAPGVWIDGEKISINGKSGSKGYVNDRELRLEPEKPLPSEKKKKPPKAERPAFYLTAEDARSFNYQDSYTGAELKAALIEAAGDPDVKAPTIKEIDEWLLVQRLIGMERLPTKGFYYVPTPAGVDAGLRSEDKVSARGTPYSVLLFTPEAQRMVVEHFIKPD